MGLTHILADVKNLVALQLGENIEVCEVRFETNDHIDDLVLITTTGRALIQAKRSLSLSDSSESEYSSVLRQFVNEYIDDNRSTDAYVLATSSRSSQRITKELKKLTEAARLNDVLAKTRGLIQMHYETKTGNSISEVAFNILFQRIRISIIDIEDGAPF